MGKPARHKHTSQKVTAPSHQGRTPNLRGKAIHNELFPPIDGQGRVYLPRNAERANINRAGRQVAKAQRTPWRRPKPVYTEGEL